MSGAGAAVVADAGGARALREAAAAVPAAAVSAAAVSAAAAASVSRARSSHERGLSGRGGLTTVAVDEGEAAVAAATGGWLVSSAVLSSAQSAPSAPGKQ